MLWVAGGGGCGEVWFAGQGFRSVVDGWGWDELLMGGVGGMGSGCGWGGGKETGPCRWWAGTRGWMVAGLWCGWPGCHLLCRDVGRGRGLEEYAVAEHDVAHTAFHAIQ